MAVFYNAYEEYWGASPDNDWPSDYIEDIEYANSYEELDTFDTKDLEDELQYYIDAEDDGGKDRAETIIEILKSRKTWIEGEYREEYFPISAVDNPEWLDYYYSDDLEKERERLKPLAQEGDEKAKSKIELITKLLKDRGDE